MAYTTGTLTGTYPLFDGEPAEGTIEIIPSAKVVVDDTGHKVLSGRVKVTLDNGTFSVELPASDDDTLNPSGVTYTVAARLRHANLAAVSGLGVLAGETTFVSAETDPNPAAPSYQERVNEATTAAAEAEGFAADADASADNAAGSEAGAATSATAAAGSATAAASSATAAAGSASSAAAAVSSEVTRATAAEVALQNGTNSTFETRLSATYSPVVTWDQLFAKSVIVGAHRIGQSLYPYTLEGMRAAVAGGADFLDMDAQPLSDGAVAISHDDTVDNLTTSTGNVSNHSASSWGLLNVDAGTALAPAWPNTLHPATFTDVLNEFGGRVPISIEAKTMASVQSMVDEIVKRKLQRSVLIQAADTVQSALAPAITAGIPTAVWVTGTGVATDVDKVTIAGVDIISLAAGVAITSTFVNPALAAGYQVWAYQWDRHYDRTRLLALGVTGLVADDPGYAALKGKRTSDPFALQTWYPGMILDANDRGQFISPNRHGWTAAGVNSVVLDGWISPITATTYTITATATFDAVGGSASAYTYIHVCAPDDQPAKNGIGGGGYRDGYRVQLQQNGTLAIFKTRNSDGTATAVGTNKAFTTPTAGSTVTLTVQVTPTQIIATAGGQTDTVTDSEFRGGYVHRGQSGLASSLKTSWSAMSVA